ncbi:hypothetical protein LZ32DRAFT_264872 [Colletotrichum eremochloae]|nr:hypothetical protein LZ32DRAFT_264872 [Colletotrichum eremochloae]
MMLLLAMLWIKRDETAPYLNAEFCITKCSKRALAIFVHSVVRTRHGLYLVTQLSGGVGGLTNHLGRECQQVVRCSLHRCPEKVVKGCSCSYRTHNTQLRWGPIGYQVLMLEQRAKCLTLSLRSTSSADARVPQRSAAVGRKRKLKRGSSPCYKRKRIGAPLISDRGPCCLRCLSNRSISI